MILSSFQVHVLCLYGGVDILQVEEGCHLATVDDIAAAIHRMLCLIQAEATAAAQ